MREILPGIIHWTTFHKGIGQDVHSYYVSAVTPACLIDARVPDDGIEWFDERKKPENIYLTNRHHYRHSGRFEERFGSKVWCHREGLHEFVSGESVEAFNHGDTLPGGVLALEVGVLCPEETTLYIPAGNGALSIGDAIIREEGKLGFVPDFLMGSNPEGVKRGLKKVFTSHLKRNFDAILFAHGEPVVKGAKKELREFLKELNV